MRGDLEAMYSSGYLLVKQAIDCLVRDESLKKTGKSSTQRISTASHITTSSSKINLGSEYVFEDMLHRGLLWLSHAAELKHVEANFQLGLLYEQVFKLY
jgi:TPR repeat protein